MAPVLPEGKPGDFPGGLPDPATAASSQLAAGVRGPGAPLPHCRCTQGLDDPYRGCR